MCCRASAGSGADLAVGHGRGAAGAAGVTTGLSMLLLFVLMERVTGWPQGRGAITIAARPCHLRRGLCHGGHPVTAEQPRSFAWKRRRPISARRPFAAFMAVVLR